MSYYAQRVEVRNFLFIFFSFLIAFAVNAQDDVDENMLKSYFQYATCNFEKTDVVVLLEKDELTFTNNFELQIHRTIFVKFLKSINYSETLNEVLFYHDKTYQSLDILKAKQYSQDPQLMISFKDIRQKLMSASKVSFEKGQILQVEYIAKYFYTRKMPVTRIQLAYPIEKLDFSFVYPDLVKIEFNELETITPDIDRQTSNKGNFKVNGVDKVVGFTDKQLSYSQIPSAKRESFIAFADDKTGKIGFKITEIKRSPTQDKAERINGDMGQAVVEQVLKRKDILSKLITKFEVPKAYDYRIQSISNKDEKIGRIYDLVRRNFRWNNTDSVFIDTKKSWESIWNAHIGTGSEINLMLVKVLLNYGFEVSPMLVSTRNHGAVNREFTELADFNRIIAVVYYNDKAIPLDATQTFGDYPILCSDILNTWGLSISMTKDRWMYLEEAQKGYNNSTLLLGTILNDASFRTNVYVNSFGYSKASKVAQLERDSIKYFIKSNFKSPYAVRHFIVANEYIDSLPLAQEFDIEIPIKKDNDLRELNVNFCQFPDSLKSIDENRLMPLEFGYNQRYDIKGEFSFPENYQIYLLPSTINLSILNGDVVYSRNYHATSQSFSYNSILEFKRSTFTEIEAREIGKLMKKINNYQLQNAIIRKMY